MTVEARLNSEVLEALHWRYATKKFDSSKKIPQETWAKLEEALVLSPSSFGMQPYRFVVVTDPNVKQELVPASYNQMQVADCSHFVIFARIAEVNQAHVDHYIQLISKVRNIPVEAMKAHNDMMSGFVKGASKENLDQWAEKQCYIALGNLMTAASLLKVDNCPMEGISKDQIDRILQLPEKGCYSVVACALGYRAEDDKYSKLGKVRFPASELFIHI
jgi:nitroreductase